jgi:hypothetical protein
MDNEENIGVMGWLFGIPLGIAIGGLVTSFVMIPIVVVDGFVLSILWSWFVSPVLGCHELGILQAIGILMVARQLTNHLTIKDDLAQPSVDFQRKKIPLFLALRLIVGPLGVLVFGFVIHSLSLL